MPSHAADRQGRRTRTIRRPALLARAVLALLTIALAALVGLAAAAGPATAGASSEGSVVPFGQPGGPTQSTSPAPTPAPLVTADAPAADHPAFVGAALVHGTGDDAGAVPAWLQSGDGSWTRVTLADGATIEIQPGVGPWRWAWTAGAWHAVAASDLLVPGASPELRPLQTRSPWLVDGYGRQVVLHGVNVVNKRTPYLPSDAQFSEVDAQAIADDGFNLVRLGITWKGVEPDPWRFDDAYLARARSIADMLARHGVRVLLDMHQDMANEKYRGEGFPDWALLDTGITPTLVGGFPAGYVGPSVAMAFDNLWADRANLQAHYAEAWVHAATAFRDAPGLVGYDLLNEPWAGSSAPVCALPTGCRSFDVRRLQPFYERVIARIRTVDTRAIAWWEPNLLALNGAPDRVGSVRPLADPARQTGVSFHTYCILGGMVPHLSRAADPTCPGFERRTVGSQLAAARTNGSAALLTEFGSSPDVVDIARVAAIADQQMVGWAYWAYAGWDDPTGWPGEQGLYSDDAVRPGSLRREKAAALVRPYPEAIAGRAVGWSFEPLVAARPFRLTFDADPAITAPTVVFVPRSFHYPHGYVARVAGPAVVASPADAPLLLVRTVGAGRVQVQVTARP